MVPITSLRASWRQVAASVASISPVASRSRMMASAEVILNKWTAASYGRGERKAVAQWTTKSERTAGGRRGSGLCGREDSLDPRHRPRDQRARPAAPEDAEVTSRFARNATVRRMRVRRLATVRPNDHSEVRTSVASPRRSAASMIFASDTGSRRQAAGIGLATSNLRSATRDARDARPATLARCGSRRSRSATRDAREAPEARHATSACTPRGQYTLCLSRPRREAEGSALRVA